MIEVSVTAVTVQVTLSILTETSADVVPKAVPVIVTVVLAFHEPYFGETSVTVGVVVYL